MEDQNLIKAVLALFFLHFFCLGSDAEDPVSSCDVQLYVKRSTVVKAALMDSTTLSCPVILKNCDSEPIITWCKVLHGDQCFNVPESHRVKIYQERSKQKENEQISHLKIQNVTKADDGLYRCKLSHPVASVSHSINLTISESDVSENHGKKENKKDENTDTATSSNGGNNPTTDLEWLPYVYICVGIVGLVILVMLISFLSLHGCKRTTQSQKPEEAVQAQCPTRRSSARAKPSPSVPKRDRSLRCQPTQSPVLPKATAYDNNHFNETHSLHGLLTLPRAPYSQGSPSNTRSDLLNENQANSRDRRPSQVLYAALDHLTQRDASRTAPKFQPQEEFSEYASIRIS